MALRFSSSIALVASQANPSLSSGAPNRALRRLCGLLSAVAVVCGLAMPARSQTNPTPNTFSTLAGGYSGGSYTAGAVCGGAGSGSKYTALDAMGNGCPATMVTFSTGLSGIGVDGAGNIFVNDYSNSMVRRIDARSGIVTKVIGAGNTNCSTTTSATGTKQDSIGSGCAATSAIGPTSARGMNVDPWGNVIVAGYNANQIDVICLATSPLCPNTANRKQVGFFYRIAGCIATQGNSATANAGIAAYSSGDNSPASPFQNLSGDVAAWGLTGTAATAATVGATGNACSATTGGVNQARNAQADKYGNVYIADTNGERYRVVLGPASYNSVINPLFAIINMDPNYTAREGFIYTILGSFTAVTSGGVTYNVPTASAQACDSASGTLSTDAFGDGCAFFETGKPAGATSPAGIGVDKDGNPIFSDNTDGLVRVLYVGGATMAHIISVTNGGITPVAGTVYAIEGTGTASKGATPQLNVSNGSISSGNTKVAVDGSDNIYLSDGSGINIIDSVTGYLRRPISTGGTACATGVNGNGDGCPAGQGTSYTSLSSVGTAIAVDNLGNMLLADSTGRVRRVLAGTLYPTAVGSSFTQNVVFHEPAGTTGITVSLLNASPGITIPSTAPTCTLFNASGSDNTADCTVAVTFAPTVAGKVGATLSVTNVGGGGLTMLYPLTGQATGAALVTDVATPTTSTLATFGSNGAPTSMAIDTGGNLYTIDNHTSTLEQISPSGTVTTVGTVPTGANQVAVDAAGTLYVTAIGSSSVTNFKLTSTGSYNTSTVNTSILPQGIVADTQGNLYVSDATSKSVYQVPNNNGFANLQGMTAVATGLANPTLLALDGLGNLLIADTGIVYRVNASTGALTTVASASAGGTLLTALTPVGLAADAGGNVYIQDGASKSIFEIPYQTFASGAVTVLSGETTPSGVAVDGRGQVYAADSGLATPAVIQVQRASATYTFPTGTTTFNGAFSNAGNANATGYAETDTAEFPYSGAGTGGCGTINGTSALLSGAACTFSVTPNLGGNGLLVTNTTTLLPATSIGSLVLTAQEPLGVTYTTTTTVTGPASAVFASTGTEITFTVAESSANNNSQNGENVNVTIDSGSPVAYVLSGGTASVPVSGLTSGTHTISATYAGDGTYLTSSGSATFSILQAPTTVTWNPSVTTQQYSAALGTGVLDATAAAAGLNAPGSFIYTATPTSPSGPAVFVHSASYLPIGTYSLGVTFIPNDAVDYAQSTATIGTYTVTKASTSASVGATQMLVAADGTGNFSTVQAAVNALPTGGSIYIKPGVYNGNIAVVQPNIALRGLGGDPTKVVLTHSGGAFNNGQVQNQFAGEFNQSQSNGSQLPAGSTVFNGDEASATLIVAKGINTAVSSSTLIPNNFYGENFSLINTYNTDTTTTTNVYTAGGATPCVVNSGAARTYSDLFNSGLECASQALAIWTTSDLSVMNNVYTASLQDTIYAASQGNSIPARQYWFRGKVTGTVDYIFGDAAAVFDSTSIYTAWHGNTATGTETIHAQNKAAQTGSVGDYLSGYVMNNDVFTSQSTGMTNLFLGRPYGTYSTWIMLNSYIDQVNPTGYTTGLGPTLTPVTFSEYNDIPYTDPAPNANDRNGIPYVGTGGNTGAGVAGPREASSTNPGTPMANDNPPTAMTQAQAQAFFPGNFLSQPVASSSTVNWNPTAAIAANANAFIPSGGSATVAGGSSVTILMRPQTPGLGAVTNGVYTIPTGTYILTDTYNSGNPVVIASGSLDASGEAYFTSSSLADGTHILSWTYSGDNNFAGSTTSAGYVLTVTGPAASATTTTLNVPPTPVVYGSAAPVSVQVTSSGGTPTGNVTLTINGTQTLTASLNNGVANFSIPNLTAATYSISASYTGSSTFIPSSSSPSPLVVNPFQMTLTGVCANRPFGQANSCSVTAASYQYTDSAATVFATGPTATTTATTYSPANTYTATPVYTLTAFGNTNYVVTPVNGSFTVSGNTNLPQAIIFAPLPNFASGGAYQLTARTTSGLPVSYTVISGNASITGSTLTVSGPGAVTVQASQTDPTGDYATATPVSRSFTAQ